MSAYLHNYECTCDDGRRVRVNNADDREAAEVRAARHFGCTVAHVRSRYVSSSRVDAAKPGGAGKKAVSRA